MKIFFLSYLLSISLLIGAGIPENQSVLINSALQKALGVNEFDSLSPLSGGFSSQGLYKIVAAKKPYVVRFIGKDKTLSEKTREIDAMQISAKRGVAPRIIFADVSDGMIIMDFIDQPKVADGFNPLSDKNLKLLGKGIRTIHEGPPFKKAASFFTVTRLYEREIKGKKPQVIVDALALLNQIEFELKDSLMEKPCHYDIHPNNILFSNDQVFFIDWEAACQGDPFVDLATPIAFFSMDETEVHTLLVAYFGREPNAAERTKLTKMIKAVQISYGFTLIAIAQERGEAFLTEKEMIALPSVKNMGWIKGFESINRFGFALLKESLVINKH